MRQMEIWGEAEMQGLTRICDVNYKTQNGIDIHANEKRNRKKKKEQKMSERKTQIFLLVFFFLVRANPHAFPLFYKVYTHMYI